MARVGDRRDPAQRITGPPSAVAVTARGLAPLLAACAGVAAGFWPDFRR